VEIHGVHDWRRRGSGWWRHTGSNEILLLACTSTLSSLKAELLRRRPHRRAPDGREAMDTAMLALRASAACGDAASGGGVELPLRLCLPCSKSLFKSSFSSVTSVLWNYYKL
jgi:hypothetical protein